jgi:glycyl-tRNA synthetase beta chain
MTLLASLRKPIDAFFDTVTVNIDDEKLKENRYALLNHFISLVNQIADFSKLQG